MGGPYSLIGRSPVCQSQGAPKSGCRWSSSLGWPQKHQHPYRPRESIDMALTLRSIYTDPAAPGWDKGRSFWKQSGSVSHSSMVVIQEFVCYLRKSNVYNFLLCFALSFLPRPLPRAKEKKKTHLSWSEVFARIASITLYWTNFRLKKKTIK